MGDVAPRAPGRVELVEAADQVAGEIEAVGPARQRLVERVGENQLQQVVDAALLHLEPAVHVALAEPQLRVVHELTFESAVADAEGDRRAGAVAVVMRLTLRIGERQLAAADNAAQENIEQRKHDATPFAMATTGPFRLP